MSSHLLVDEMHGGFRSREREGRSDEGGADAKGDLYGLAAMGALLAVLVLLTALRQ